MLLRYVVEQLETELNRLYSLRDIVATLQRTPQILEALAPSLLAPPEAAPVPTPKILRPRRRSSAGRATRAAAVRTRAVEPTPLRHAIPQGPVVISAQQLARERQRRVAAPMAPEPHEAEPEVRYIAMEALPDLDVQSRALASRWIAGSAAH